MPAPGVLPTPVLTSVNSNGESSCHSIISIPIHQIHRDSPVNNINNQGNDTQHPCVILHVTLDKRNRCLPRSGFVCCFAPFVICLCWIRSVAGCVGIIARKVLHSYSPLFLLKICQMRVLVACLV